MINGKNANPNIVVYFKWLVLLKANSVSAMNKAVESQKLFVIEKRSIIFITFQLI